MYMPKSMQKTKIIPVISCLSGGIITCESVLSLLYFSVPINQQNVFIYVDYLSRFLEPCYYCIMLMKIMYPVEYIHIKHLVFT
jgi:hypothetical protein